MPWHGQKHTSARNTLQMITVWFFAFSLIRSPADIWQWLMMTALHFDCTIFKAINSIMTKKECEGNEHQQVGNEHHRQRAPAQHIDQKQMENCMRLLFLSFCRLITFPKSLIRKSKSLIHLLWHRLNKGSRHNETEMILMNYNGTKMEPFIIHSFIFTRSFVLPASAPPSLSSIHSHRQCDNYFYSHRLLCHSLANYCQWFSFFFVPILFAMREICSISLPWHLRTLRWDDSL